MFSQGELPHIAHIDYLLGSNPFVDILVNQSFVTCLFLKPQTNYYIENRLPRTGAASPRHLQEPPDERGVVRDRLPHLREVPRP